MNKAKRYYVDSRNIMVHRTNSCTISKATDKPAIPFHAKLKISGLGWMNSGVLFYLEDKNGATYVMNDVMMREYIKNADVYVGGDWEFYQQGTSYSIGLVK